MKQEVLQLRGLWGIYCLPVDYGAYAIEPQQLANFLFVLIKRANGIYTWVMGQHRLSGLGTARQMVLCLGIVVAYITEPMCTGLYFTLAGSSTIWVVRKWTV